MTIHNPADYHPQDFFLQKQIAYRRSNDVVKKEQAIMKKILEIIIDFIKIIAIELLATATVLLIWNQYNVNKITDIDEIYDQEKLYNILGHCSFPTYIIRMPDFEKTVTISDTYNDKQYLITELVGEISKEDVGYLHNTTEHLPAEMKQYLIDNNWKFVLTDQEKLDNNLVDNAVGLCRPNDRTIYVSVKSMREQNTILHEIGHVLYYAGLKDNMSKHIQQIDTELNSIYMHDVKGNPYLYCIKGEQIAQLLVEYCLYPESLKRQTPVTYTTIEDTIKNELMTY